VGGGGGGGVGGVVWGLHRARKLESGRKGGGHDKKCRRERLERYNSYATDGEKGETCKEAEDGTSTMKSRVGNDRGSGSYRREHDL